ncbi:hypothetical protein QYF61_016935 [Mycteria americana]|uniref:RNase H type-1 domain-containing protein n=1 Tax=Mycteria americana TaxID=33587 RepID=A0AAN7RXU3_MYCAM|nr:hypothetical protein QYF61_016935 [Mycteria americana]
MGYSIPTVNEVVDASPLSPKPSAQADELIALSKVYQLAKEKTVNIYADSQYAFRVCHATGQLWKLHGFITSSGSKISSAPQITELLKAMQLPEKLAIIHQPAHTSGRTKEEIRNSLRDIAAKATARQPYKPPGLQAVQWSDLVLLAPEKICLTVPAEEIDSCKSFQLVSNYRAMLSLPGTRTKESREFTLPQQMP